MVAAILRGGDAAARVGADADTAARAGRNSERGTRPVARAGRGGESSRLSPPLSLSSWGASW
jgi:hypothetical protein